MAQDLEVLACTVNRAFAIMAFRGKGKGSRAVTWIPVKKGFGGKSGGKGKFGRSFSKGKGKGKKGRRNLKPKKAFSELSEERKEELRAKHEEIRAEQGREDVGDDFYFGTIVQRGKSYGWIKPSKFGKLPEDVQEKIKEMVKAKKAIVKKKNSDNDVFNQSVLFVHMSDVEEGVKVSAGDKVKFKVYTDSQGAGAREVTSA